MGFELGGCGPALKPWRGCCWPRLSFSRMNEVLAVQGKQRRRQSPLAIAAPVGLPFFVGSERGAERVYSLRQAAELCGYSYAHTFKLVAEVRSMAEELPTGKKLRALRNGAGALRIPARELRRFNGEAEP